MTWHMLAPLSGRSFYRNDDPVLSLRRELDRVFDDIWRGTANHNGASLAGSLRLDVKEDDKAFHITADLPGLTEKDVEITFDDGTVTIRGEKRVDRDEQKDTWHLTERSYGSFARQLKLPTAINAEAIEAKFSHGVLTVVLPKQPAEVTKTKKIQIKAG